MMKKINKAIRKNIIIFVLLNIILGISFEIKASPVIAPNEATHSVNEAANPFNVSQYFTPSEATGSLQMILIITVIALAPSILIMMTAFLRIVITLHFVRSAVGTQTVPPNQVLIGIALFLTFFVMSPVITQIKTNALEPYEQGKITKEVAIEEGLLPLKDFMLKQADDDDVTLFMQIADMEPITDTDAKEIAKKMPLYVVVPAFIVHELRAGFIIGFMIYIPFIVIDMVVAATLMSMGMMMLPPATISLPFKVLLFVLVDGWGLIIGELLQTFN